MQYVKLVDIQEQTEGISES